MSEHSVEKARLTTEINRLADLAAEHRNCTGCPTPWWLTDWLMKVASETPIPPAPRLANACKCGDCYHPAFGPNTDGEPCDWCQDCGCAKKWHLAWHPSTPPDQDGA